MKKQISITFFFLVLACSLFAQQSDYKVVFDLSSRDSISQQALIREIGIIKGSSPNAQIEVVVYGMGLSLVLKDKSNFAEQITKFSTDPSIQFKVCAITMKRNNVDESKLVPGVMAVPDGIYELISKQRDGWGYIKVAH